MSDWVCGHCDRPDGTPHKEDCPYGPYRPSPIPENGYAEILALLNKMAFEARHSAEKVQAVRELCEARKEQLAEMRTIESAPKDGTRILAFEGGRGGWRVVFWRGSWNAWQSDPGQYPSTPTHWMPLPEKPE